MQPGLKKTFIWLFTSLAVAALLLALALTPTGVDKWEAMTNRIDRLKVETRSLSLQRSVLRGKTTRGNAWDEYNIALKDAQTWVDDQNGSIFVRFANGVAGVDRVKVEQLVADHEVAIEHLRLGVQRSDGQYPYNWERGSLMQIPSLLGSRRLANDAVAQAKIWAEKGRPQDAADLLLDVTVFGKDLATNGPLLSTLIGFAMYSTAFDELRHLLLSGKLTQKQLAELAKKLETVDHDFPALSSALSTETLGFGMSMLEESGAGTSGKEWLKRVEHGDWRLAIAPRATMLDAFEIKEGYLQRSVKFDQMNFEAIKRESTALAADADSSPNSIIRTSTPNLFRIVTAHRETLAQLRLLRAGATFLGTGEVPELADPFGSALLHKQEGGKSKIWSIGSDGTNQNGVGNWEGRPGPDMVLEIPK